MARGLTAVTRDGSLGLGIEGGEQLALGDGEAVVRVDDLIGKSPQAGPALRGRSARAVEADEIGNDGFGRLVVLDGQRIDCGLAQALDLLLAPDAGDFASDDGEECQPRQDGKGQCDPAPPGCDGIKIDDQTLDGEPEPQQKQAGQGREQNAEPGSAALPAHGHHDAVGGLDGVEGLLRHLDGAGSDVRIVEAVGARLAAHAKRSPSRNSRARSRRIWGILAMRPAASTGSFGGRKRGKRKEPGGMAP
jgi:hypothetical protein